LQLPKELPATLQKEGEYVRLEQTLESSWGRSGPMPGILLLAREIVKRPRETFTHAPRPYAIAD
jgi:hypothetical protein